jgi:hypothetical protein
MKISIALAIIIVGIGLTIGYFHRQRLAELREDRDHLAARAAALGIDLGPRLASRQRNERENRTRSVAADMGDFARHLQIEMQNDELDASLRKRAMEILDGMTALEPGELSSIIAGLRKDKSLAEETLRNLIGFSIMMLAAEDPATALALFAEAGDLVAENPVSDPLLATSLGNLAKDDPRSALKWLRENPGVTDTARHAFLAGAAQADPALAFQMTGELGFDESSEAIAAITEAGKSMEQRAAILSALRDHLAGVSDPGRRDELREEALGGIARSLSDEGFESLLGWISSQKLDPVELSGFTGGMSYDTTGSETGRWIGWMEQTVPAGKLNERVSELMGQWTQQDYLAAGQWLVTAPDGPGKSAAVKSYAVTIAEYEPRIAGQWALTLTDPEERSATLERIYQNLPKAAAAAFAAEHGIAD